MAADQFIDPPRRRAGARPRRRATIDDVAAAAGVSVATVSRALRGLPNVAESTRRRVEAVASELRYAPDPAAARLAAGRTGTITIGVPQLDGWYFSTVVAGAEGVARADGYEFQVMGVGSPDDRDRLLDDDHHLERLTDGLILVDIIVTDAQVDSLERRGVDLTTVGAPAAGRPVVGIDDEHVGELAADHLAELGHRRIALIEGSLGDPLNFTVPRARRRGFEAGLARHGLELDPGLVVDGDFDVDGGRRAMSALLELPDRPTAAFSMSDEMAFGAILELRTRGLVPGVDVALLGVDDHEFSRIVELSTIRQPVARHGKLAAGLLVDQMRARAGQRPGDRAAGVDSIELVHRSPVELVVRSTTGRPVASRPTSSRR